MRLLLILMLCFTAIPRTSMALSFLDKEHSEKLLKEARTHKELSMGGDGTSSPYSISPLQLFRSPIQPGGKYMLNVNLANLFISWMGETHPLVRKITKGLSLVDRYVEVLLDSDLDVVAFRNDPTPHRGWKTELKALKDSKRAGYRAYVLGM